MDAEFKHALPRGYRLEDYVLKRVLGEGGFSVTYLAEDVNLGNEVAIKEYLPNEFAMRDGTTVFAKSGASREDFEWGLQRFLQEARILARFRHPNVVRVVRRFEANNTAYIVMDYEDGASLAQLLERHRTLDEAELKAVLAPLADGLKAVHAQGFLHRDIKPDNVYVRRGDETPVLLDFGAARNALGRRSRTVWAVVAAGYSPPEQYETDGEQGPCSDIYAFAALCYRAAVGKMPLESPRRVRMLLTTGKDPLPTMLETVGDRYSEELCKAVDWGLRLKSADRPQQLEEWLKAIEDGKVPEHGQGIWPALESSATDEIEDDSGANTLGPALETTESESPPLDEDEEKFPFFLRLARGDFGLARTYWLFGVLAGCVVSLVAQTVDRTLDAYNAVVAVVAIGLVHVPYQIVVAIGVWRAAGAYRGPRLWGVLAKTAVVVGVVLATGLLLTLLATLTNIDSPPVVVDPPPAIGEAVISKPVRYGTLAVDIVPDDAVVTLFGTPGPYRPGMRIEEGGYRLTVTRDGYLAQSRDFDIDGDTRIEIRLRREALPPLAAFTVETKPAEARVRILNIGPRYKPGMVLESGEYRVEVSAPGFVTKTEMVQHGLSPTLHLVTLERTYRIAFRDCPTCPEMVWIRAGEFTMGSNRESGRFSNEGPVHPVRMQGEFAIGIYEVTFDEWEVCVSDGGCAGSRPENEGWGGGSRPVINVSWEDARRYVDWLTEKTGFLYRLPSESEWEYVARAGTTTARYWGQTESGQCRHANGADASTARRFGDDWIVASCDDSYVHTTGVGDDTFRPNEWGLHHVLGNVSEWTADCWHANYVDAPEIGAPWIVSCEASDSRVVRGGNWSNRPQRLRSAYRSFEVSNTRANTIGFRVVRSAVQQ